MHEKETTRRSCLGSRWNMKTKKKFAQHPARLLICRTWFSTFSFFRYRFPPRKATNNRSFQSDYTILPRSGHRKIFDFISWISLPLLVPSPVPSIPESADNVKSQVKFEANVFTFEMQGRSRSYHHVTSTRNIVKQYISKSSSIYVLV